MISIWTSWTVMLGTVNMFIVCTFIKFYSVSTIFVYAYIYITIH